MSEVKTPTRVSNNSDVVLPFRKSDESIKNEYTATEHMILDSAFQADEDHALTVFGGILTIISTILGGGIVGLPYGFYQLGLFPGTIFMVVMGLLTVNSSWIYIKSKDLIPGKPESLYEIGYMLFKRSSIFIISACLAINSLGLCMVYFIIFGKTTGSIYSSLFIEDIPNGDIDKLEGWEHFLTHRIPWITILAIMLLPIMVKKELQELHIVSVGLFVSILVFIFILFL